MVNSKSIITYKLVYDPDKKKKCKTVQVEQNGTTNFFAIPIVSGEKGVEFQLNEQTKPFFELLDTLNYTGQQKLENYGKYLFGAIKTTWELVMGCHPRSLTLLGDCVTKYVPTYVPIFTGHRAIEH